MPDPSPQRQPPSIQDVAAAAGVSTATVSRVLNNPSLVAAGTAERVQAAIRELGYRPNLMAQGLMTRRTRVIGIALPDIHGEFYSGLLRGADAEAHRLGYHLLVSSEALNGGDSEAGNGAGSGGGGAGSGGGSLAFGLINGLVLMITEPNERLWREARQLGMPIVVLDSQERDEQIDSVMVDSTTGAREAMMHLLAHTPPERCYFVGGPRENFDTQRRAEVFRQALRQAGHEPTEEQFAFGQYDLNWGLDWVKDYRKRVDLRSAAVLAGDDEIALGIVRGAEDAGLAVPGDLRVVGFDDTRIASLVRPSLSSVRVPLAELGAAAIATLVRRIDEPSAEPVHVRIPTTFIVRESSAVA